MGFSRSLMQRKKHKQQSLKNQSNMSNALISRKKEAKMHAVVLWCNLWRVFLVLIQASSGGVKKPNLVHFTHRRQAAKITPTIGWNRIGKRFVPCTSMDPKYFGLVKIILDNILVFWTYFGSFPQCNGKCSLNLVKASMYYVHKV